MSAIKTCLALLLVLLPILNEQLTRTVKNVLKKDVCSREHLKFFQLKPVSVKDTFPPSKSSKDIRKICPTLETTCCSLGNVQQLRNSVIQWNSKNKPIYEKIYQLKVKIDKTDFNIFKVTITFQPTLLPIARDS